MKRCSPARINVRLFERGDVALDVSRRLPPGAASHRLLTTQHRVYMLDVRRPTRATVRPQQVVEFGARDPRLRTSVRPNETS
jgi:hypothetical protein